MNWKNGESNPIIRESLKDLKKLKKTKGSIGRLLLYSIVFESKPDLERYRDKLFDRNQKP